MSKPVIDDDNPFYCPKIPASMYLRSLRRKVQQLSQLPRHQSPSLSFSQLLEHSAHADHSSTVETALGSDWIPGDYFSSGRGWFSSPRGDHLPPPYSPVDSTQVHDPRVTYRQGQLKGPPVPDPSMVNPSVLITSALKRKSEFSDFAAPPKYARSIQSLHDSSFDLELKREVLHFSEAATSPHLRVPSPAKATRPPSPPSLSLVEEVALALPGIRLRERLKDLQRTSSQDVMTFLSDNGAHILTHYRVLHTYRSAGYINKRILNIFSKTDVESIIFAPSLFDENGLNVCPQGIYSG